MIAAIGPANRVRCPPGALRIDARGKYLMPGLADFHTHVVERGDLALYLASGVTTIANMGEPGDAPSSSGATRSAPAQMTGPEIYVGRLCQRSGGSGRHVECRDGRKTRAASWSDAARDRFDFIKVYNSLTADQFTAVMEEAKARRLPVLGHAVRSVGLERGFGMGQVAVVHAEEYGYAELRGRRDSASIEWAVGFTRGHDATLIPNLSAFEVITLQWGKPAVVDSFFALPEVDEAFRVLALALAGRRLHHPPRHHRRAALPQAADRRDAAGRGAPSAWHGQSDASPACSPGRRFTTSCVCWWSPGSRPMRRWSRGPARPVNSPPATSGPIPRGWWRRAIGPTSSCSRRIRSRMSGTHARRSA